MNPSNTICDHQEQEMNSWHCPRCTLLNGINEICCKACQYECANRSGLNGLFQKIKLPHFSINGALEKLDSAIDLVASTLTPRNGQNVCFYPPNPGHSSVLWEIQTPWACPTCLESNSSDKKRCLCDITSSYWTCANSRCSLKQPNPPHDAKCPLCRTKTTWQKLQSSRSMPQLTLSNVVSGEEEHDLHPASIQMDDENQIEHSMLYKEIGQQCRINHQNFMDDSFPHSARSIGSPLHLERKELNIVWLRPEQIMTRDGRMTRWSVFNDPQPTDIEQGYLGNCWFLSALAVVAERPDILEKLFLTKQYNHTGIYEMRLCIDGIWQRVLVDDYFPCHKRTRSMVFGVGRKNQLWVPLLEKALAKAYGNYGVLRAGRTVEGLCTLTGAPARSIDLECTEMDSLESREAAMEILWAQLLSSREARFIMGCSCGAGKRPVDEKQYRRMGLMSQHAYSLLDVKQTSTGHRVVQLRNPWGSFVWLGQFSQAWTGWTPQLLAELASEANSFTGTFWMPFDQFTRYFDTVDIAQIHGNWHNTRYLLDIGWIKEKTRIVRLTITDPTELCVTLHQKNARTVLDQVDLMLTIHKQDPSRDNMPGELFCRSARKIQPVVCTEYMFFPAGEYLVCAHSFAKFGDASIPSALVIHSSKNVFCELLTVPLGTIQESISSLILAEGIVHENFSGGVVRYLTNDFAGLALMVDNTCHNYCVQICSDFKDSSNILSTRSSLVAYDSVPPLHRQIITILTHFEPSQAFVVSHKIAHRSTELPQLRNFAPSPDFYNVQNYPPLVSTASGFLHGPSSLFT